MSFMPSPGSIVELADGRFAMVIRVTPDGRGDKCRIVPTAEEIPVVAWDIRRVISEPLEDSG